MTTPILFSIIIPTYNRPEILSKTLDCLEKQEVNFSYEVIVVDDCSTIPLPDLGFGKERRFNWKMLRNGRNLGRAATRNRGIRESKGEYILMIDDDIWVTPGLLHAHYEAQKRIAGSVVVGSMFISAEVRRDIWNDFYRRWINNLHDRMEKDKNNLSHWYFFTGNVSLPKILVEEVGFFDESFNSYGSEDSELGYRLWEKGIKMVYEPTARAQHFNDETLESILKKRENWGRSHLLLAKKHPELAEEISIAGILVPGKRHYQIFIKKPFLLLGKKVCVILAMLHQTKLCWAFLEKLSLAYNAFGMIEALNINQKQAGRKNR